MKIALVSLDIEWEQPRANLTRAAALVHRAAAAGADFVVFPELTLTGFTMQAPAFAEPAGESPTIEAFAALAQEARVHVAFGVILQGGERPENTLVVITREGREAARYAKLHSFRYAGEHRHYSAGEAAVVAVLDDVAFGLTICYDLRFPELYTTLAPAADVILVIANWPTPRIAHWDALLRARALDAQCWVAGVNRVGRDGVGLEYPRSSQVIDPSGNRATPTREDGELQFFTIDAAVVRRTREVFPVLADRRPDLYRRLGSTRLDSTGTQPIDAGHPGGGAE